MGSKLNFKWGSPLLSPILTNSPSVTSSYSSRCRHTSYDSGRVSFAFGFPWHSENLYNDLLKAHRCPSALETLENDCSEMEGIQMAISKTTHSGLDILDGSIHKQTGDNKSPFLMSLQARKTPRFRLLMENLDSLEATFNDSESGKLEMDILMQLQRLGALKLFNVCLSRTIKSPTSFDLSDLPTQLITQPPMNASVDFSMGKVIVRSRNKEKRKSKRERASHKTSVVAFPSKSMQKDLRWSDLFSPKRPSNSTIRRRPFARNEADMARGVKLVDNLERIKTAVEEETGREASLSSWAEAAGVEKKVLRQHLHFGWCCRDKLLRSAHSLVVYIARNYRGVGVPLEDLIQAGNVAVLQGAVRFDHSKGYKFSTYVQYWIKKSMSKLVERHARDIRIPFALNKAISQIREARIALSGSQGKYPEDEEIAKFTGLSLAKITSASQCLRVVGSIDQKMGDGTSAKFLEYTADTSIKSPEEAVMRQHMMRYLNEVLKTLDPRERQVLVLRFGLGGHQCKSLEEIGRYFNVSKEWIRRTERTALKKLRDEESLYNLSRYLLS